MTIMPYGKWKNIVARLIASFIAAFYALPAYAVSVEEIEKFRKGYLLEDPLGGKSVPELIARIISQVLPLVGALFLLMFIWGGIMWMTAGGDSAKVQKATKTLTNAVIGIAIVVFAYVIVSTLLDYLAPLTAPAAPAA